MFVFNHHFESAEGPGSALAKGGKVEERAGSAHMQIERVCDRSEGSASASLVLLGQGRGSPQPPLSG